MVHAHRAIRAAEKAFAAAARADMAYNVAIYESLDAPNAAALKLAAEMICSVSNDMQRDRYADTAVLVDPTY